MVEDEYDIPHQQINIPIDVPNKGFGFESESENYEETNIKKTFYQNS